MMFAAALLSLAGATGCARKLSARLPQPPARIGSTETGIASWYGLPYHGRRTASGEIYDMERLTAAHKTLPFDTWVEVTNLKNGKLVDVRINDRGPFVEGRIVDLSRSAAREIDMVGAGTARVKLKVIAAPARPSESPPPELYAVQAGEFTDRDRAETLRASLCAKFGDARVVEVLPLWRVLVGRALSFEAAMRLATEVRASAGNALLIKDR